jgi:hypothetical protein
MLYFALSIDNADYEAVRKWLYQSIDEVAVLLCSGGKSIDISGFETFDPEHELKPYRIRLWGQVDWQKREWLIDLRIQDTKPLLIKGECKEIAKEYALRVIRLLKTAFNAKELTPEAPKEKSLTGQEVIGIKSDDDVTLKQLVELEDRAKRGDEFARAVLEQLAKNSGYPSYNEMMSYYGGIFEKAMKPLMDEYLDKEPGRRAVWEHIRISMKRDEILAAVLGRMTLGEIEPGLSDAVSAAVNRRSEELSKIEAPQNKCVSECGRRNILPNEINDKLDSNSQSIVRRIINATSSLPADITFYAFSILAVCLYWDKPEVLIPGIGINLLSGLVERMRHGNDPSDEEIREVVKRAVTTNEIQGLLQEDDFQRTIAKLMRRMRALLQESEWRIIEAIIRQSEQYSILRDELKTGQADILQKLDTLATKEEMRHFFNLILERLPSSQSQVNSVKSSNVNMGKMQYSRLPKTLEAFGKVDDLQEWLRIITSLARRLEKLPKRSRKLLSIIVERAESGGIYMNVSSREILNVSGLDAQELYEELKILEKYEFLRLTDDDVLTIQVFVPDTDGWWSIWDSLLEFCQEKSISFDELIVDLRFDYLDSAKM